MQPCIAKSACRTPFYWWSRRHFRARSINYQPYLYTRKSQISLLPFLHYSKTYTAVYIQCISVYVCTTIEKDYSTSLQTNPLHILVYFMLIYLLSRHKPILTQKIYRKKKLKRSAIKAPERIPMFYLHRRPSS